MLRTLLCTALIVAATPAISMEGRFSAINSDVATGLILTGDHIDAPRDTTFLGRLTTIMMGIQDLSRGSLKKTENLQVRAAQSESALNALQDVAAGVPGYRAQLTALANRLGKNVTGYTKRLRDIQSEAGLLGTDIEVVRAPDGGPGFEGYTTARDMDRLVVAVLRADPKLVQTVFASATGGMPGIDLWFYEDGICALAANGPVSHRKMAAVMSGAPDATACFKAAAQVLKRDDTRISKARKSAQPS